MRAIIVIPCLLLACAASGCSRQESGWRDASDDGTVAGYEHYLERFPAGAHAPEARARILELRESEAWARARRLETPEAWQRYLGEWPEGRHANAARRLLVEFIPRDTRPAGGSYLVQLGAYSTEAAARADLARITSLHPATLEGVAMRIVAPDARPDSLWRLRTFALAEAEARTLCTRLREGGVDCVPLPDPSAGEPAP
jgi:hypothetical protein